MHQEALPVTLCNDWKYKILVNFVCTDAVPLFKVYSDLQENTGNFLFIMNGVGGEEVEGRRGWEEVEGRVEEVEEMGGGELQ